MASFGGGAHAGELPPAGGGHASPAGFPAGGAAGVGGGPKRTPKRHRYERCVFALATVMLATAALSTMALVRSQPALSEPVGRVLSRIELRTLRNWYCDKLASLAAVGNATALQRFLNKHHTTLAPGDMRDVPHHPDAMGRDGVAGDAARAAAAATCTCDCRAEVAAASAAAAAGGKGCGTDCSRCGGGGSGGHTGAVAAALESGNLKELTGHDLLEAVGADLQRRFTDVTCYLHGDESEVCAYHNAICYDGVNVVFSVPVPPTAHKSDPNGYGLVLGDPTGACFDYRYYEPTALEYTTCKYDLFKFQRSQRYSVQPYPSPGGTKPPRPPKGTTPSPTTSRTGTPTRRPAVPSFNHKGDWPLPLTHRRWGPLNRGAVRFREVADAVVFGPRPAGVEAAPDGALVVKDPISAGRAISNGARGGLRRGHFFKGFDRKADRIFVNLTTMGLNIVSVTQFTPPPPPKPPARPSGKPNATQPSPSNIPSGPRLPTTVYWTDASLWFVAMDAQFDRHIYHATTRLMGLYHAQRQNASAFGESDGDGILPPLDGRNHPLENHFMRWARHAIAVGDAAVTDALRLVATAAKYKNLNLDPSGMAVVRPNRQQFHSGASWDLPPQDAIILTGPSANFASTDKMIAFLKGVTELVAQPHTRWFTNAHLTNLLSPNSSLLCAPRGAVTGTHPRLFVNRGDAWMFRSNAYAYAHVEDLGLQPHPHHPPRKITVLLRKGKGGRNFENLAGLMAIVNATGLPVEYIDDMGRFTFKQQIARMAGTGILIAAHGAALVNAMFLPQHAVVIEIFPWKFKKATYINLAALLGLWHLPIYTGRPANMTDFSYYGIRMAWQNASNGQNFFDGCVAANVSSVDALLHFRCNAVSKALPINVPLDRLKETLDEALDIIAAFSAFNEEWAPQLAVLQGKASHSGTPSRPPSPSPSKPPKGGGGKGGGSGKGGAANATAATASPSRGSKTATRSPKTASASKKGGGTPTASPGSKSASKKAAATASRTRTPTKPAPPPPPPPADDPAALLPGEAEDPAAALPDGGEGSAPDGSEPLPEG